MEVSLIVATTLDGFIGRSKDDRSFDWTSYEDKRYYVANIKAADAIIMGSTTFNTFKRYPKGSTYVIYTREPDKFTNPKPHIINTIATKDAPKDLIKNLEKKGFKNIIICGGASIYFQFMKSGLVDKLLLTVEPVIFGNGIKLFSDKIEKKLKLIKSEKLNEQGTMVLEYEVEK